MEKIGIGIYDVNGVEVHNGDKIYSKEMVSGFDRRNGDLRLFKVYYKNGSFWLKNDVHDIPVHKFIENGFSIEVYNE